MTATLTLLRAAQLLESNAEDLKRSHTFCDGEWCITDPIDESAKSIYDEEMAIAAKLRAMAA